MKNFVKLLLLTFVWLQGAVIAYGQCNIDNFTLSQVQGTCASDAQLIVQSNDCKGTDYEALVYKNGAEATSPLSLDATGKVTFMNLAPNEYEVFIREKSTTRQSAGKKINITTTYKPFTFYDARSINASCNGAGDGGVIVRLDNTQGGVGPYQIVLRKGTEVRQSALVPKSGVIGHTSITLQGDSTNPITTGVWDIEVIDYVNNKTGCRYSEPLYKATVNANNMWMRSYFKPKCTDCDTYDGILQLYQAKTPPLEGNITVKVTRGGTVISTNTFHTSTRISGAHLTQGAGNKVGQPFPSTTDYFYFNLPGTYKNGDRVEYTFEPTGTTCNITGSYTIAKPNLSLSPAFVYTDTPCGRTITAVDLRPYFNWTYTSLFCQRQVMVRLLRESGGTWIEVPGSIDTWTVGDYNQYLYLQHAHNSAYRVTTNGKYKTEVYILGASPSDPHCKFASAEYNVTQIGNSTNSPLNDINLTASGSLLEGTPQGVYFHTGSNKTYSLTNPLELEIRTEDGRTSDTFPVTGPLSLGLNSGETYKITYPVQMKFTANGYFYIQDLPVGKYKFTFKTAGCPDRVVDYEVKGDLATYDPKINVVGGCRQGDITYNLTQKRGTTLFMPFHYARLWKDTNPAGTLGNVSYTDAMARRGANVKTQNYNTNQVGSYSSTEGWTYSFTNVDPGRYIVEFYYSRAVGSASVTVIDQPKNGYAPQNLTTASNKPNPYYSSAFYAIEVGAPTKVTLAPTTVLCDPNNNNTGIMGIELGSGDAKFPISYTLYVQDRATGALTRAKNSAGQEIPVHTINAMPPSGDTYHAFTQIPRLNYANQLYVVRLKTACFEEDFAMPDFNPNAQPDVRVIGGSCPGAELILDISLPSNIYNFTWHSSENNIPASEVNKKRVTFKPTKTATYWVTYTAKDPAICGSGATFKSKEKQVVIQNDTTPPTITQIPNQTLLAPASACVMGTSWTVPTVTDPEGCLHSVTWKVVDRTGATIYTPPLDASGQNSLGSSWTSFPLGTSKVIYTATDTAGNTSTMEFEVVVRPQTLDFKLTSQYKNDTGTVVTSTGVGSSVNYEVTLDNAGNEDVRNVVIKVTLPSNTNITLPTVSQVNITGITTPARTPNVQYDATTRTFTITNIDDALFKARTGKRSVLFPMKLSNDCKDFENACTTSLNSKAEVIFEGGSSGACPVSGQQTLTTQASAGIDLSSCTQQELFCGAGTTVTLTATGTGYTSYQWYLNGSPISGATSSTYTANSRGTYTVERTATCSGVVTTSTQTIQVLESNDLAGSNDPIRAQADGGATCSNDGTWVSHFFLCDGNSRVVNVTFNSATRIVWQRYNASCTYTQANCQSRSDSCWTDITTGGTYTITAAGDYRLRVEANGCTKDFYFSAYTAGLSGRVDPTHQTNFTAGSINVTMYTTGIPYTYTLKEGSTVVQTFTKTTGNTHEHIFQNLSIPAGGSKTFTVEVVSTAVPDCKYTETIVIRDQATMTGTVKFIDWVDCDDANFEFEAQGGRRPYKVAIYSIDDVELHPGVTLENIPASAFTVSGTATQSVFQGVFNILKPGSRYKFVIRDADNKNVVTNEVTVPYNPDYQITTSFDPIECAGKTTTVTAKFVNPLPQRVTLYRVATNGTRTQVGQNNSGIFPNTPAGTYVALVEAVFASHKCSFEKDIVITEPSDPLVGYAGVVKDILCDTSSPQRYEVHINNVSGGRPPYQYSFDSGNTWQSSPIGFISNTTQVLVRDTSNCDPLAIDVVVDPAVIQPTVPFNPATDITYDCDGKAIFTVTPQNPPGKTYTYQYAVDNGVRQTSNTFALMPKANGDPYIISIYYEDPTNKQRNTLFTENFGTGDDVCNAFVPVLTCAVGQALGNGSYVQTKQLATSTEYTSPTDASGTGRYLALVTSTSANILYQKTINNVIPQKEIAVSLQYINLLQATSSKVNPSLRIELVVGGTTYTRTLPAIARGGTWTTPNEVVFTELATANTTNTSAVLRIVSGVSSSTAVGLDNIQVSQPTETCQKPVTLSVTPRKGQEFKPTIVQVVDAECNGGTGKVIIEAKNLQGATSIEYSIDGGVSWHTANLMSGTTNRFEITNLSVGTHTLSVRRDANCVVPLTPVTIGEPDPITIPTGGITATPLGCVAPYTTSIVTVRVNGGVRPYQPVRYRLQGSGTWLTTNSTMSNSGIGTITGLGAGTYEFNVVDTNNCGGNDPIATFTIAPVTQVTISTNYTQCYSGLGDAFITVTANTGSGDYEFSKDNGVTFERPLSGVSNVFTFDNLSTGVYQIIVRDRYGCTATETITIYQQLAMQLDNDGGFSCRPNAEEKVTLRVTGGKDAKTFKWRRGSSGAFRAHTDTDSGNVVFNITSAGTTTTPAVATVTIKTAGEYYFVAEDANLGATGTTPCSITQTITIATVNPEWKPNVVLAADDIACAGASTGSIGVRESGVVRPIDLTKDIDASKGVPPFRVEVYATGTTAPDLGTTNLAKGTYIVRLIDSKECYVDTTVVIGEVPAVNLTLTKEDITCKAGVSVHGKITASWSNGGTSPFSLYVYNSQGVITRNLDTGNVHQATGLPNVGNYTFEGFAEGTYTLVMIDAKGCRTERQIAIGGLTNELVVEPQAVTSCGVGGASAKLITYNRDGSPITANNIYFALYTGGNPATYPISVWNQASTDTYTVGGVTYPAASYMMTGLTPGVTYQFVVNNNGCYAIFEKNIPLLTGTTTKVDSVTGNPACGAANGSASFTLSGIPSGVTSLTYQVYTYPGNTPVSGVSGTVSSTATFPQTTPAGLARGQYYIVFTEAGTNCVVASIPFTVLASDVPLGVTLSLVKNETCNTSAELSAVVTGGTNDFKYIFKNVNTPPTATEWAAVTATANRQMTFNTNVSVTPNPIWYVFVQDKYGCVESSNVTVIKDNTPIINTVTPENLCGANGQYRIRVRMTQVGVGQHYYTITRGGVTSAKRPVTIALNEFVVGDIYSDSAPQEIKVYDQNNCESLAVQFTILDKVTYDVAVTRPITCDPVTPSGQVTISNIQNFDPSKNYFYRVDYVEITTTIDPITGDPVQTETITPTIPATAVTSAGTSFNVTNPGIYRVYIDENTFSCPIVRNVVVQPKEVPVLNVTNVIDEKCSGTTAIGNGVGAIAVTAGSHTLKPFAFKIVSAVDLTTGINVPIPANYATYTSTSIANVVDIDMDGTRATFQNLMGTPTGVRYEIQAQSVNVTNYNGVNITQSCESITVFATVRSPQPITVATNAVTVTQFACNASQALQDAKIEINTAGVAGGNGDYTYVFFKGTTEVQRSKTPSLTILDKTGGVYSIKVIDKEGCEFDVPTTYTIDEYASIETVTVAQTQAITCATGHGENITVSITTDPATPTSPNYTYYVQNLSGGYSQSKISTASTEAFTGLTYGTYKITVRDNATGCETYASYDVKDPNTFVIKAENAGRVSCYGGNDGTIDLIFVDIDHSNGDQSNDGFSYVITSIDSGTPVTLTGTIPSGTNTGTVSGLRAGMYKVVATSTSTSCTTPNESQFSIRQAQEPLQGSASLEYDATCTNDQGEILVELVGGVSPYKVTITGTNGYTETVTDVYYKHLFTGLSGGSTAGTVATYTITVEDDWGCTNVTINTVDVTYAIRITATAQVEDTKCEGGESGSIEVLNPQGGAGATTFYYDLKNKNTGDIFPAQRSPKFENLSKGEYTVGITDRWGCTWTQDVTIKDPDKIEVTEIDKSSAICYDEVTGGYITIQVKGGTPGTTGYTVRLVDSDSKIIKQELLNVQPNTNTTINNLRPEVNYEIQVVDPVNCEMPIPYEFVIPFVPDLTTEVNFTDGCNNNTYESRLEVKFKQTLDWTKVTYTIGTSTTRKTFDSFSLNYGYIENPPASVNMQTLTIHYQESPTKVCTKESNQFFVRDVGKLDLEDMTHQGQLDVNEIKVQGKFGVEPYNYSFNGESKGTTNTYLVKRTDPDVTVPSTPETNAKYPKLVGKTAKLIKVQVTDALGCTKEIDVYYKYIDVEIPRYFTPNGDGTNDSWAPKNTNHYPHMTVEIFDRYGRYIKHLRKGESWDGKYQGKDLPTGDYWYIFKLNSEDDPREFKGHFTLYR